MEKKRKNVSRVGGGEGGERGKAIKGKYFRAFFEKKTGKPPGLTGDKKAEKEGSCDPGTGREVRHYKKEGKTH